MKERCENYYEDRSTTQMPSGIITVDRPFSFSDKLSVTLDEHHGDFKSPQGFEASWEKVFCLKGTITTYDGSAYGGGIESIVSGNSGIIIPALHNTQTVSPVAYNKAISSLYSQERGDLDLSINAFQAAQTSALARSGLDVLRFIKKFRPSDLKKWRAAYLLGRNRQGRKTKAMKDLGSKWLAYTYGLKPLVSDLYGTSEQLQKAVLNGGIRIKARASNSNSWNETVPTPDGRAQILVSTEFTERIEIVARYAPKSTLVDFLSGFTSLNPASIAWELMPFSFVVDWVVDVGGYMRSLESACVSQHRFLGGYITYGVKTINKGSCNTYIRGNTPTASSYSYNLYDGLTVNKWKKRVVLLNNPLPRPPGINPELGSGRLLNAAALLSQFLGIPANDWNPALTAPRRGGPTPKFR